jgi:hydrogenase/urease accessory protein HupE
MHSWYDGFSHPLYGWDHLIVMVTVGIWASQQEGRARWAIPATFLSAMAFGGLLGALGIEVPLTEPMILLSVISIAVVALFRVRVSTGVAVGGVALFALFHGYAHGHEMPGSALLTYGAGFLTATALMHACGYFVGRLFSGGRGPLGIGFRSAPRSRSDA